MHDIVSLLRVRVNCLMSALFRIDPTYTVVSVVSWPWSAYALLRVLGVRLGDWGWIVGGRSIRRAVVLRILAMPRYHHKTRQIRSTIPKLCATYDKMHTPTMSCDIYKQL